MSGYRLAVDYGTSFTAAAIVTDGARPEVLEFGGARHSRYLPSMVMVDQRGELHVGIRAVSRRGSVPPEYVCAAPKRQLVDGGITLGPTKLSSAQVVGATLKKVAEEALHQHNGDLPAELVMTHPAAWSSQRCEVLRQSAVLAGLTLDPTRVRLLEEPVAAANFYAEGGAGPDIPVGASVGVYDLGGGTFDCAILTKTATGWVLAGPPGGDERLGGEDFDEALLEWVADRASVDDPDAWGEFENDDSPRGRSDWIALLDLIRTAKEDLSQEESTEVGLPPGVLPVESLLLNRAEFLALIVDGLERSTQAFARCLDAANVKPRDLAALYLTGGSSRIPAIKGELHRRFGVEPTTYKDPKAITALGALVEQRDTKSAPSMTAPKSERPPPMAAALAHEPEITRFECPDIAGFALAVSAAHQFAAGPEDRVAFQSVIFSPQGPSPGVCAGTSNRVLLLDVPGRATTAECDVYFEAEQLIDWLRGRQGSMTLTATRTRLTVTQLHGQQPLSCTVPARVEESPPPHGTPSGGDVPVVGAVDVGGRGMTELAVALQASSTTLVSVVLGMNSLDIDGHPVAGDGRADRPVSLWVERRPLLAVVTRLAGTDSMILTTDSELYVVTKADDSVQGSFWGVDPAATRMATDQPAIPGVATVRVSPKAALGGVGAMGVAVNVTVDGRLVPTNRWEPVEFQVAPGSHHIEVWSRGGGQEYSRARATIQTFAGQRINLVYQQAMTTFQSGKLVLQ